jgi:hypothetical protein
LRLGGRSDDLLLRFLLDLFGAVLRFLRALLRDHLIS